MKTGILRQPGERRTLMSISIVCFRMFGGVMSICLISSAPAARPPGY